MTCPLISPQTSLVPSGENATHVAQPFGSTRGLIRLISSPVLTSKSVTDGVKVLATAAATSLPSGENAIPVIV